MIRSFLERRRLLAALGAVLFLLLVYSLRTSPSSHQTNVGSRHQSHDSDADNRNDSSSSGGGSNDKHSNDNNNDFSLLESRRVPLRFTRTESHLTAVQFACSIAHWSVDDDDDDDDANANVETESDKSAVDMSSARDLLAIFPVVDAHTHHINVFACDDSIDTFAFDEDDCCARSCFYDLDGPCHSIVFLWDKGARAFHVPPPYGIRVGQAPRTRVLVQVHSLSVPGGMRRTLGADLVFAPTLRDEPAHWFLFDDTALVLPAGVRNATTAAVLREGDICDHLTGLDETLLLAVHLHMHNRGRSIVLQRTDGDGKVHVLHRNDRYGGYGASQDVHWLTTPLAIPHDGVLSIVCEYDTRNATAPISFGLRDADEMCAAALLLSGPINDNAINFVRTRFG